LGAILGATAAPSVIGRTRAGISGPAQAWFRIGAAAEIVELHPVLAAGTGPKI